jgi:hypothetical protein
VDLTDTTRVGWSRRRRLRRWLGGNGAPPSLRAQLALMAAAFLFGAVVCAVLFVGIWRHTAAEGDRARSAQLAEHQHLRVTQRRLATLETRLSADRAALTWLRKRGRASARELASLRQLDGTLRRSLPPTLQSLTGTAASLAHATATLKSELGALRAYMANAGASGLDPGFVNAQISYLVRSTAGMEGAVATLGREAEDAQAAAAKLGRRAN